MGMLSFDTKTLILLFKSLFEQPFHTRLVGGADEALYQPGQSRGDYHRIYFRRDYFASALHEVAHWCIAGRERRQQLDYGYWYHPDGRNPEQQRRFEQAECKPQALEWIFSRAAGYAFRVSIDNLNGGQSASESFTLSVKHQALDYCCGGLPSRARQFADGLRHSFSGPNYLDPRLYQLEHLQ